jgi:hypothetical protein
MALAICGQFLFYANQPAMNKQNFDTHIRKISRSIRQYLHLKTELYSLIVLERFSRIVSYFVAALVLIFFLFFFILFISMGFVSWFGEATNKPYLGYLIVSAFYLVVAIIVYSLRRRIFYDPIIKVLNETIFEKEDEPGKEFTMEDPYAED